MKGTPKDRRNHSGTEPLRHYPMQGTLKTGRNHSGTELIRDGTIHRSFSVMEPQLWNEIPNDKKIALTWKHKEFNDVFLGSFQIDIGKVF